MLKFIFLTLYLVPLLDNLEVRNRKRKNVLTVYIQYKLPSSNAIVNEYESYLLTEFLNYSLTYIFRTTELLCEAIKYGTGIYFIDLKVSKIHRVNGIHILVTKLGCNDQNLATSGLDHIFSSNTFSPDKQYLVI